VRDFGILWRGLPVVGTGRVIIPKPKTDLGVLIFG